VRDGVHLPPAHVLFTNTNDSNPADIAQQLTATVGEAVAKAAMTKPPTIAWDLAWERFAGLYRGLWGDRQVVLLNKKLAVITPNGPNLNDPVMLEPLGGGQFRVVARTGGGGAYGVVGEIVRFVEQSGRPMRMYAGGHLD
jgi:D-alanyl-D-alanine carboxypeptidase